MKLKQQGINIECIICGKNTAKLLKARIEGSILEVCESCVNYGELIPEVNPVEIEKRREIIDLPSYKEDGMFLIENYGKVIVETRGKKGLNREEFAQKIKEKESVIKRIENEEMMPDDALTDKIEKFLEIKLRKPYEMKCPEKKNSKKAELTIGDVIKVE